MSLWNGDLAASAEATHAFRGRRRLRAFIGPRQGVARKCRVVVVAPAAAGRPTLLIRWEQDAGPRRIRGPFQLTGEGRAVTGFEGDFSLDVTPEGTLGSGG